MIETLAMRSGPPAPVVLPSPTILQGDEALRRREFPITCARTFLAHAGVTALPRCASAALQWFGEHSQVDHQEAGDTLKWVDGVRASAANLIGAQPTEIALLGPTALGLNLVADGIDWQPGDEVVFHRDDYPANVYPWRKLAARGVGVVAVTGQPSGRLTWETIEPALTSRTRLVSLASAHFLTGYRIDIDEIGRRLHERGILFCVDAIQTLGAFPLSVKHVDFLSADSHKWLLGPMGAGIVYVSEKCFEVCRPTLLGSWNVVSPRFIAQESIDFYPGARRYEPGSLNLPGIFAMGASIDLLLHVGIEAVAEAIGRHRAYLVEQLRRRGWQPVMEAAADPAAPQASGIVSFHIDSGLMGALTRRLDESAISVSIRHDREGAGYLRISPHFYNTRDELDRFIEICNSVKT